ncbi:transcription initiation factor TFIID subunit 8-like [Andrographis paniculata]|uniref:transcription initiation factor TFIID subunit 8-like n=1 Tax=Andrographis paniculata TaxID=175694 RepID=UPI0021E76264|nr:transcription initiation factor TFIID subunit 8-like [Andrographis paniculata]XP_051117450.1 transcription initiation factor TFIID subunit 8-like [Andrographis paniculata]XP_051117451.1 transcription initiation factor TFIID subunit 8-like [Andrographis paniculata]XP_051117452.1 transcription initiation factor TFIID subunit 8-like [Andrographis paniculata]XP_051117454.1 transcription initiation factor TFIID subunit 8-like [Andrographis paniculata]XP_051117455.1 transcription initiation facto
MSDGDGKESVKFLSEKDSPQRKGKKKKLAFDEFAEAIARIAVVQVCESVGFQTFQQAALDTLADVGVRYIREVGKVAVLSCNSANRSQCNVFDVIKSLEDLGLIQGFPGAADVGRPFSGSGIIKDMMRFIGKAEEIPFAYSIPVFPLVKRRTLNPSFAQAKENPPHGHIPSWLPKFPDPETYAVVTLGKDNDIETTMASEIQQVEEKHRKVEMPLQNMQQKLLHNGYEGVAVGHENATQTHRAAASNPFLAPPIQFWEREVSLPVIPAKLLEEDVGYRRSSEVTEKDHITLETSLKANETKSRPSDHENGKMIVLSGRPTVHFKIGNSKHHLTTKLMNVGTERLYPWFDIDISRNAKTEIRAENIIFEDTEQPPDSLVN